MRDSKDYRDQAGWRMSPRYDDHILMGLLRMVLYILKFPVRAIEM